MIRVILADDHNLVRQGIRSLLEKVDDIEIVAEAENGLEAVNLTQQLEPDVLVMDINMPRLTGIQAAEQINNLDVKTQVIILSMHSDKTLVRQALRNGVRGYLLKRSVMEELLLAVRAANQGDSFLSPAVSGIVMDDFLAGRKGGDMAGGFDQLSSREREVLKLVAEGHVNKDIAELMFLSVKTIEKHRSNLIDKLGVRDLPGLVRIAIKYGLVSLDD